jgi:hypothetical protein
MSDMEQGRLVRWALSHAIDREGQVEVLQGGYGTPLYQEVMGPLFPGWQPDRTVTAAMIKAAHEKYTDSQTVAVQRGMQLKPAWVSNEVWARTMNPTLRAWNRLSRWWP